MKIIRLVFVLIILFSTSIFSQTRQSIALLKYNGGGDWYANPTSIRKLIRFANENIGTNLDENHPTIDIGSSEIFLYPFLHLTGHGNIVLNSQEASNLRKYLIGGGFLHIDDNYGLRKFIEPKMKKVFPELEFVELPTSHPIYNQTYIFPNGLPKIHEHDNKAPKGYGLIWEGRLICFFSYESDLGDGWEDEDVHNDPYEIRLKALRMGSNLIEYVFMQ